MLKGFGRSRQGGEEAPLDQLGHPEAISRRTFGQGAEIIQMDNIWLGKFAEGGGIVSTSRIRTARGSAAVTWTCRAA